MNPWGPLQWLLPLLPQVDWGFIGCASFEERCVAVPHTLENVFRPKRSVALRIVDPPSRFSSQLVSLTDRFEKQICEYLPQTKIVTTDLLAEVGPVHAEVVSALDGATSVILDVSALPKRFFLFILRRLLASNTLQDLVVTYATPGTYPEGVLTQDARPPSALPGFARISETNQPTLIVSVGYVAFDINDLIQQAKVSKVKFVFPFPPGSPAFRRNWRLMDRLMPDMSAPLEIRRIHALDVFEVLNWLRAYGEAANGMVDMVPLGPKPHSIAMALAYQSLGDSAQVLYPQPTTYRPDYSQGIAKNADGENVITAYCLRRDGRNFY